MFCERVMVGTSCIKQLLHFIENLYLMWGYLWTKKFPILNHTIVSRKFCPYIALRWHHWYTTSDIKRRYLCRAFYCVFAIDWARITCSYFWDCPIVIFDRVSRKTSCLPNRYLVRSFVIRPVVTKPIHVFSFVDFRHQLSNFVQTTKGTESTEVSYYTDCSNRSCHCILHR